MVTARGEQRRAALVEAARAVLEAEGFAAVSHRAVAARAGLPLAATTYYFASRDELVEHALRRVAEAHLAHARARVEALPPGPRDPEQVAATLVAIVTGQDEPADPAGLLTAYERYVEAGRQPRLRPLVRAWNAELIELAGEVLRRRGYPHRGELPRLLVALIDGLLITLLVEGDEHAPAAVRASLARALTDLRF